MPEAKSDFEQVIIIGGTGQIGHRMVEAYVAEDFKGTILATSREVKEKLPAGPLGQTIVSKAREWASPRLHWGELDFESDGHKLKEQLLALEKFLSPGKKTVLILAAAFTNVDGCEIDPEKCKAVNESNTLALLYWAQKSYGAKIVFYSTDYVFDGESGPYAETDKRNAVSVYGQSKANVEEWLERNAADSLILRTTGVFDYIPGSKNFLMQMISLWGDKKHTKIPSDQISNPIWSGDIVYATRELLDWQKSGHYGVAGASWIARTEFSKLIAKVFNLDPSYIDAIKTADLGQKAKRPLKGGLKIDKLKKELDWSPMGAEEALRFLKKKFMENK